MMMIQGESVRRPCPESAHEIAVSFAPCAQELAGSVAELGNMAFPASNRASRPDLPQAEVVALPGTPGRSGRPAGSDEIHLRLIATSDLHACLMPFDYYTAQPTGIGGLTGIASRIDAARAGARNSLLFDNGDFLQGNPLADYVAATPRRSDRAHPVIAAFNALGYDAATLGNHEFDYGLTFLNKALAAARFPVVSANIATRLGTSPARDRTLVPPFALLRRTVVDAAGRPQRLKIGVIGFAPPQIEIWDRDHLDGKIRMRDILAAARAWLPRLRARGADVIVALAHSGIGPVDPVPGMEDAATALAALPEIDAVIAGHSHLSFPGNDFSAAPGVDPVAGRLAGKPGVMPGHSASHLGIIDLWLRRSPLGPQRWQVGRAEARLDRPGPSRVRGNSASLRQAIASDHRAALAWSQRVIGRAAVPLSTCFATAAPSAALQLIAEAKADYARGALAGTPWAGLPILASAAPFRAGGRGGADNFTLIPAGDLQMRHLSDLYVYPNKLVALTMTAGEVQDWLEQSAALFHQIAPGSQDAALHDVAVPSFTFDVIPGLSYAIDLSQPARFAPDGRLINPGARRIVGLALEGRPIDPAQPVVLVTNNHRASRAIAAAQGPGPRVIHADGTLSRDVICAHVRAKAVVGARPARHWHFLPMPGTSVRLVAGRAAEAHLADIAPYRPEGLGTDDQGFQHYRLHL